MIGEVGSGTAAPVERRDSWRVSWAVASGSGSVRLYGGGGGSVPSSTGLTVVGTGLVVVVAGLIVAVEARRIPGLPVDAMLLCGAWYADCVRRRPSWDVGAAAGVACGGKSGEGGRPVIRRASANELARCGSCDESA